MNATNTTTANNIEFMSFGLRPEVEFGIDAITEIVSERLAEICEVDEVIMDDFASYEKFIDIIGREPTVNELYAPVVNEDGISAEAAGQCLKGEGTRMMERIMPRDVFDKVIAPYIGQNYYQSDVIARGIVSEMNIYVGYGWLTRLSYDGFVNLIRRVVDSLVAHERRHAVQPASQYPDGIEKVPYFERVHEKDAYWIQGMVLLGKIPLAAAITAKSPYWNPNEKEEVA